MIRGFDHLAITVADIEQTIQLGAHGPRRLHIVLIEDGAVEDGAVDGG